MEEQEFEEILTYLSKSKYPQYIRSKDRRSNWRKKCRPFTYCKDVLYYNHKKYGALMVIKGVKEKRRIIESSHLQSDGRHHGINRTLKKICTNYYWKTIAKDVQNYIKVECQTCIDQIIQQSNTVRHVGLSRPEAEGEIRVKSKDKIVDKSSEHIGLDMIGNILEPSEQSPQQPVCSVFKCESVVPQSGMQPSLVLRDQIMAHCGLDVVGPLSETHRGKRFVVILTDCVTKWVEAAALAEFTTESVGNFLAESLCRHGLIEEIVTKHTNNDFCARLTEKMNTMMGISIRMSTFLPPSQPNGYLEHYWYNSLLCGALIKYSNQNQYYWDVYLQQVILAYRTFHQKNTPASPFQLLYDRPNRLPVLGVPQSNSDNYSDEQEALSEQMTNYIKALSCPTHHQSLGIHTQPNDRLTPPYITADIPPITEASSTPSATSQQPQQNAQVIGTFTPTVQANNQIHSDLPLTTLGTSLQQTTPNSATIYTIPSNGITAQTITAAQALSSANTINTQNIQGNSIPGQSITAQTIQTNSATSHSIPTNSHILTTPTVTPVASQVISNASVAHTSTVQTATNITSQTTTDAPSGHVVMIHTDGKAYTDSFYVICPQV
ncbi:hypothetical protein Pmani_029400 [Petrolisthes manimaculis]|uniref:RNA-directed DNA polymerase n=1 Tax=Petrolisthes manimaculis TaxID=1843537 RepID=A0AAE1NZM6_9EUCA|nr:hypothetical protein Pmani_029400 [Petrolisthes manimaculis]